MTDPLRPQFYLTASEAYPALERAFLDAETEIIASFRIFDPTTKLRSDAGRAVGATWADLIRHVVDAGVQVTLRISDFDPIVGAKLHRATHLSVERLRAAVGSNALFDVQPSLHPAKAGSFLKFLLWPRTYLELRKHAACLRDMSEDERTQALRNMPGLRPLLRGAGQNLRARVFPPADIWPVTHHQKLAVFDRKRLYIGGLDVNDRRYDTLDHSQSGEQTWHDVQAWIEGPQAAAAHEYLSAFASNDAAALERKIPGLLRTYSAPHQKNAFHMAPRQVLGEIAAAHLQGFKSARNLIYIETQYFRDRGIAAALSAAARRNPNLGIIIVLPAAPEEIAFERSTGADVRYGEYLQAKCIDMVSTAFGARLFIAAAAQPRSTDSDGRAKLAGADLIYVHAKVTIFDDTRAIISSANLNGRSMQWDTEAGVAFDDPQDVARLRQRCFAHWFGLDNPQPDVDGIEAVEMWRDFAQTNQNNTPSDRRGYILPYPVAPARRFGRNVPGLPEETV